MKKFASKQEVLAYLKEAKNTDYEDRQSVYETAHEVLEILKTHAPNTLLHIFTDAIYVSGEGMNSDLFDMIINDVDKEM